MNSKDRENQRRKNHAVRLWAGASVMRRCLGYEGAEVTIEEDGSSYVDPLAWDVRIQEKDLILIWLAALLWAHGLDKVDSQLISLHERKHPDMVWVSEILTDDHIRAHFPPRGADMEVICQNDALCYYWQKVKNTVGDSVFDIHPFMEECFMSLEMELHSKPSLSGEDIDRLFNGLEAVGGMGALGQMT